MKCDNMFIVGLVYAFCVSVVRKRFNEVSLSRAMTALFVGKIISFLDELRLKIGRYLSKNLPETIQENMPHWESETNEWQKILIRI